MDLYFEVLSICTEPTTSSIPYCDVEKLNRLLHREMGSLVGTEFAAQLQAVEKVSPMCQVNEHAEKKRLPVLDISILL